MKFVINNKEKKLGLILRLKLWWSVVTSTYKPILRFDGFTLDLNKKTIVFDNITKIHCKESLYISSDKHLFLDSGKTKVDNSDLYYSIFENTDKDINGNPILDEIDISPIRWSRDNRKISIQ